MESKFCDLLEELNRTEKEYKIKNKQYSELQSILLRDTREHQATSNKSGIKSISSKDNISLSRKIGNNSNLEQGNVVADGEASSIKKMVKSRIRDYNSLKANAEKFKFKDKEKIKFMETLQQDNKDILGHLHTNCMQKLFDSIEQ